MPDYSSWTTSSGGIKVPPLLPIPTHIAKSDDALCDICRDINFDPSTFFISAERQDLRTTSSDEDGLGETDDDDYNDDYDNDNDGNSDHNDSDDNEDFALSEDNQSDLADEGADDADDSDDNSSEFSSDSMAHHFVSLGKIADVRSRTHCPFCRLALAAVGGSRVPDVKDGEPVSLDISIIKNGVAPRGPNALPTRILMPSVSASNDIFVDEAAMFPEITLLANDSPEGLVSLVRPFCQEKIDFKMVSNWLSMCESFHGDSCRKKPGMDDFPVHPAVTLKEFRLIDVEQGCLVRTTSNSKYAALSYVWGQAKVMRTLKDNVESLEQPGAFNRPEVRHNVPLTVKDAIQATKEIGIRYLWVDALCIVQDDEAGEKLPHIKLMNQVYEMAELVIVAMSGQDANAGLPGVRPWTRNFEQRIEQVTPSVRLGVRTAYGDDSVNCIYSTRGWTYQETTFARRQLVFAGGQVVFLCNHAGNWSEDRFVEDADFVRCEMAEGGNGSSFDGDDDIGSYEGPVQNYSDRALTFQGDIYAAFAGASQRIRDLLGIDLCHGIPSRYFDWCLLWDPMNAQKRREKVPSWSWSGWGGGAFPRIWDWYSPKTQAIQNALKTRTWIVWYHRMAHDSVDCQLIWNWNSNNKDTRGVKNFYGGEILSRFPIDCSRTYPTERILTGAPKYYTDILCDAPGSGFLQFWTVSVKLRLDKPVSFSTRVHGHLSGSTHLGIFGSSGRELGSIHVPNTWLAKSSSLPLTREFILVCEGRDERADDYKYDKEPGWKYKVMLLEWIGEYAERVAVGSIDKGGELEGSPVWKEIILG